MDLTITKSEMCEITDYKTFKETLGAELRASAEGFVRIGYLLKKARDTDILTESGYKSLTEFAQAEYGLTKDIVSRYIAINDKYSESGYSDQLKEEFRGYGVAKLAEMLTLPDSVIEEMSPELTKSEIRAIKDAVKEEEKITDIEVAIEASEMEHEKPEIAELSLLERTLTEVFRAEPEHYCRIREYIENDLPDMERRMAEELAPAGYMVYTVRVAGVGTLMVKMDETTVTITNIRSGEKEAYSYKTIIETESTFICGDVMDDHKEAWEHLTGDIYPKQKETEKDKVAPAQQKKEHVKTVKPAKKEEKKKGMEEDPYWKNLGKEESEEKGAAENEEVQKNEKEEHAESPEDAGTEPDEKAVSDNEECSGSTESPVEDDGRSSGDNIEPDEESGKVPEAGGGEPDRDIRSDMPVSVARTRCKGWIEDIVRSSEELKRYFDYENYDMAIKVTGELEKEIFEIEKLLRSIKRKKEADDEI